MKQILKHSFEAVSLLTTDNGVLDVTIVPALNQPDWLLPSSLILSVDDYNERVCTYLWQQHEVVVFHMLPRDRAPDKLVILEGNTPAHRIALQTVGELRRIKVRISEVKDSELPKCYTNVATSNIDDKAKDDDINIYKSSSLSTADHTIEERFRENIVSSYLYQSVTIEDVLYLIPDLDKIAHQLVDLDS